MTGKCIKCKSLLVKIKTEMQSILMDHVKIISRIENFVSTTEATEALQTDSISLHEETLDVMETRHDPSQEEEVIEIDTDEEEEEDIFECETCCKIFENAQGLEEHLELHYPNDTHDNEDDTCNVNEEIEEEDDEHEFFFTSTVTGLTISKTDVDGDGNPLGLETSLASGAAGSGSITIVLKHEPTKPNDGTSASAGGSTELEVTFNVTVQ